MRRIERALAELGHSERFRGLWLNPTGTGTTAAFRPDLQPAPNSAFGVGVAYDQFMSGRLWIGGVDRSFLGASVEGTLLARLGSYEQDISAFIRKRAQLGSTSIPITVGARITHESIRLFNDSSETNSAETQELDAFVGLRGDPAPGAWRYEAGVDTRLWREPTRDTRGTVGVRASLFRARNEYEMGSIFEAIVLTDYQRVRADVTRTMAMAGFDTRLRLRLGWGNRLPIQQTFSLGGSDGFAGLRIGESRGSQEAFGSILLMHHIAPQIRLRVEGMAGSIGNGYGFLTRTDSTYFGRVYSGVRAGVEANTPIGPIIVEEGINNFNKRALLFRVGHWF
jgi:hypothetical protein